MIKRLRMKFICVVMSIVALILGGILGVVIHFAGRNMQMQSVDMMRAFAAAPLQPGNPGKPSGEERLPFFAVQVGKRGELLAAGGNGFDLKDREQVQKIVDDALDSGKETGKLDKHDLRFLKTPSPSGWTLVFSDTAVESANLKHMALSCLLIFAVAMVVFLGISILLSHWIIKPVAAAWDQQRQFVADASHELKTPLSVIMANAELLQNEDTGETDQKTFAKNILSMTYQMRSLVENMLEMARVDNGAVKLAFSEVDFSQLVEDAALSVQLLYEEQELGLNCETAEGICLQGSEQHLYQVLDVLLDNARKYSTPRGSVHVRLTHNGRHCVLSVSSPGEPLSKEDQKNIFKRFYRADQARAINGSYGLGLSIAESVVEAHKGKIWAESAAGYNTFYVQLPVNPIK